METKRTIQHDPKVLREIGGSCKRLINSRIRDVPMFQVIYFIRNARIGRYAGIASRLLGGNKTNSGRYGRLSYGMRFG